MFCTVLFLFVFFFFSSRRRHTRWTGDWSSDVCSSDLNFLQSLFSGPLAENCSAFPDLLRREKLVVVPVTLLMLAIGKIGRASCRERVYISVVAGSLKKKKKKI